MSVRTRLLAGCLAAGVGTALGFSTPQAAPGLAITSVTGTIANGSTVTLNGGGFGTKPTAAPLVFDNFENGTSGSAISSNWKTLGIVPKYSNAVKRTNSNVSVRAEFTNGQWLSSFGLQGQSLPRIYLDTWYYLDAASPYSRNHKVFRIYTSGETSNLYYNLYCDGQGSSHLSQDGVSGNFHKWLGLPASYFGRKWVHLQAYFVESAAGSNNGTAEFWVDGVKQVSEVGNFRTREAGTGNWNEIWFGNYFGHDSDSSCASYGNAYTYWDDVYVDTSAARVEIGDASSYANARHREIQLPGNWSDGAISVRLNLGTFTSTSGLYLFVIDSSGNISPGYSLGGTPSNTPGAPRNLKVTPSGEN